jgi:hypothetical protein
MKPAALSRDDPGAYASTEGPQLAVSARDLPGTVGAARHRVAHASAVWMLQPPRLDRFLQSATVMAEGTR